MWMSVRSCWSISAELQCVLVSGLIRTSLWLAASLIWLLCFSSVSVWCLFCAGKPWNRSCMKFLSLFLSLPLDFSSLSFPLALPLSVWWLIWIVSAGSTAWLAFGGCGVEDAEFGLENWIAEIKPSVQQMLNSPGLLFHCTSEWHGFIAL